VNESPSCSIIIPTWNGRELVGCCLESLSRQGYRDFETLVVDDGSTDDTLDYLRMHHPEVRVLSCAVNRGFVAAVNRGISEAQGQWVFLLNNDVTLADDCLEHLMAAARRDESAMLTPLVLWTDDPRLVYSAGDAIGRNGRPSSIGFKAERTTWEAGAAPFGVSGGYGVFKRELLNHVGHLDPGFGAYFEDSDLCFRARWLGYGAGLVPEAVAWHIGSATIQDRLWWRTRQCYRNHALLIIKNFSARLLCWNAAAILRERFHQLNRVFQVARNEWGLVRAIVYTAQAWSELLVRIPGALIRRRHIMATRRLSSAAMQALLNDGSRHE